MTSLLVNTEINRKMQPLFSKVAQKILSSILQEKPVILRYHNDADGIASMLMIEQAIIPLLIEKGKNPNFSLYRMPSISPVYESRDALHDICFANKLAIRSGKKALIVILDNGSTPEDSFGIELCKYSGFEVIVIDHHNPGKQEEDSRTIHCNPYLFGGSHDISTGILASEIAHSINPDIFPKLLPAISAVSDKCSGPEAEKYIAQAGLNIEILKEYASAFDFIAKSMRTETGTGIFEEILEKPSLRKLIAKKVQELNEKALELAEPFLTKEKLGKFNIAWVDLEKHGTRDYPPIGRLMGLLFEKNKQDSFIMLGCTSSSITIRATDPEISVKSMISFLQKEFPNAHITGGGHEVAGTINFTNISLSEVLESLKKLISKE